MGIHQRTIYTAKEGLLEGQTKVRNNSAIPFLPIAYKSDIVESLREYSKEEMMTEENKIDFEGLRLQSSSRVEITRWPQILVIQLKIFEPIPPYKKIRARTAVNHRFNIRSINPRFDDIQYEL